MKFKYIIFMLISISVLFFSCDLLPVDPPVNNNLNDPANPDSLFNPENPDSLLNPSNPLNPDSLFNPSNIVLGTNAVFDDLDPENRRIRGVLTFSPTAADSVIERYRLYWGDESGERILDLSEISIIEQSETALNHTFIDDTEMLGDTILIYSYAAGQESEECLTIEIRDLTVKGLTDFYVGTNGSQPMDMIAYSNKLFFSAIAEGSNRNLYVYNPTQPLDSNNPKKIIVFDGVNDRPARFSVTDNSLYFLQNNTTIHYINSEENSLKLFSDANWANSNLSSPGGDICLYKDRIYFSAYNPVNPDYELWRDDGEFIPSPELAEDIANPGSSDPDNFILYNGLLIFTAQEATGNLEIWSFDGTNANRRSEINESGSSDPENYTELNGVLYFSANNGTIGPELYSWDGSNEPVLVADIGRGAPLGSDPQNLYVYDNKLYFQATSESGTLYLYEYDNGTVTELLPDPLPDGFKISNNTNIAGLEDGIYFTAYTTELSNELWRYNNGKVQLVKDIWSGGPSGWPKYYAVLGDKLYFQANEGTMGIELWCLYYE